MKSTKAESSKFIFAVAGALLALSWTSWPSIAADENAKTIRRGDTAGVAAFGRASPTLTDAAGSFESAAAIRVRNDLDVNTVVGRTGVAPRSSRDAGTIVGTAGDVPAMTDQLAKKDSGVVQTRGLTVDVIGRSTGQL